MYREESQNNVNPQFDQRGQVKHLRKSLQMFLFQPESGENVGHQQLVSQSSPLLGVCGVEGVRDQQAARETRDKK